MLSILMRACDALSLSNIEFLLVDCPSPNQFTHWNEIFHHCTEVTTVKAYGDGTIGLLQALTPSKRANTTAQEERRERKCGDNRRGAGAQGPDDDDNHAPAHDVHLPIFPKLTYLLVHSLDFNTVMPGTGVLFDLVLNAVRGRKVNLTPLTTLCIEGCVIREKQANALEKFVSDFRWDFEGFGRDEESDDSDYHSSEAASYSNDYEDITSDPGEEEAHCHVSLAQAE